MKIREVNENKKQFISLLLLADEQESMVDRYLEKGNMYVLEDGNVKAECVVTDEGNAILEIKNIAVDPENQGKGYGKALIDFLASKYADEYSVCKLEQVTARVRIMHYAAVCSVRLWLRLPTLASSVVSSSGGSVLLEIAGNNEQCYHAHLRSTIRGGTISAAICEASAVTVVTQPVTLTNVAFTLCSLHGHAYAE